MAPKVLCLLTEAGRIALLLQVAEHLRQLVLESQNIAPLRVESATQLSGDEKKKIEERFRAILGRGVSAFYQTDTALIGGIRATVDGVTYDGTLAAKLSVLREQLVL